MHQKCEETIAAMSTICFSTSLETLRSNFNYSKEPMALNKYY